jgi:dephospho-CoA kinase
MLRIALTGGIATGKSTILRRLQQHGIPTIDADVLAREVVRPGTPGAAAIRERFGNVLFTADGELDRKAMGALVFREPDARLALEAIVHPEVYRRITRWFDELPQPTTVAVADIPLLYETGHERDFDSVVVAACEVAEQIARIMRRDGLTEAEARQRLTAQWPIDEKIRRADRVIRTDGTVAETAAQVDRLAAELQAGGQRLT